MKHWLVVIDTFLFFNQGQDTTTSAITFALYNIAKYPEIQQKCFNEVVEVFGTDRELPATLSLLNQLTYLELVIKESLRLFSTIPVVARTAMEDIKLSESIRRNLHWKEKLDNDFIQICIYSQ